MNDGFGQPNKTRFRNKTLLFSDQGHERQGLFHKRQGQLHGLGFGHEHLHRPTDLLDQGLLGGLLYLFLPFSIHVVSVIQLRI